MNDYTDGIVTVHQGDVVTTLAALMTESVDCVVTSPPYWGLRDYGTATWSGGDLEHAHAGGGGRGQWAGGQQLESTQAHVAGAPNRGGNPGACACGAVRVDSQLGLEPTPELYVEHMVVVFREVWRVLRPTGTVWLNMGDCYATQPNGNQGKYTPGSIADARQTYNRNGTSQASHPHDEDDRTFRDKPFNTASASGLKPKDLVGMPWRLAFALQADGWWLRSDIVWSKPNPMPESVTDRPTKAHEYLFLLTKSERYYYDQEAIRETATTTRPELLAFGERLDIGFPGHVDDRRRHRAESPYPLPNGATHSPFGQGFTRRSADKQSDLGEQQALLKGGDTKSGFNERWRERGPGNYATNGVGLPGEADGTRGQPHGQVTERGRRNKRSVWTIATQPYPDAHFATFPEALVEPCILAGTSEAGRCPTCGAPWERVVQATSLDGRTAVMRGGKAYDTDGRPLMGDNMIDPGVRGSWDSGGQVLQRDTVGWQPTCTHGANPVPCTVLDPFAGSGTTLAVAKRLNRNAVGVELNPAYIALIRKRVSRVLAQVVLSL